MKKDALAEAGFVSVTTDRLCGEKAHIFEDFTDDFAVWVMFYGPEGGETEGAWE